MARYTIADLDAAVARAAANECAVCADELPDSAAYCITCGVEAGATDDTDAILDRVKASVARRDQDAHDTEVRNTALLGALLGRWSR